MTNDLPGPLDGVSVLDFSLLMAGPYCGRYLADLGADVIKVEPPQGEYMRHRPPFHGNVSTYFGQLNCGKRSIVLDLKRAEEKKQALELVKRADILIENFRPGVMRRLGLDYETCRGINPALIYCSISGFGQDGPSADRPALAQIVHAESGYDLAFAAYQPGDAPPPNCAFFTADVLGGIYAFSAINAALFARERTGRGQHIDVALMDCMMNLMVGDFQHAQFPGYSRPERYGPIRAADGFIIVVPVVEGQFQALCQALGHPEWTDDDRFAKNDERRKNWATLMSLVEAWTCQRRASECVQFFTDAGVPCGRYNTIADATDSTQFKHRDSFAEVGDRDGRFAVANLPFKMSNARVSAKPGVPGVGEHTADVLRNTSKQLSE